MRTDIRSSASQFEILVEKILELNDFNVTNIGNRPWDQGFDFQASRANDIIAVEVKYYRTKRPQPSLLQSAARQLLYSLSHANLSKGMLVVSCDLYPELRQSLEKRFGLVVVDRNHLQTWAAKDPDLVDSLTSLLEADDVSRVSPLFGESIDSALAHSRRAATIEKSSLDTRGTDLCSQLRALKPGRVFWAKYENLSDDILHYLFLNDLHGWHKQRRTDDGLNRFDFICRIRPTTDFWNFVLRHLDSRYVLFEFKNYTGKIKQGQILTTEKYLLARGLRRLGIIFSRKGGDKNAIIMTQGAMREQGKLMILLADDDVCHMLHMKERGEDPSDYLFNLADEFLLALPR